LLQLVFGSVLLFSSATLFVQRFRDRRAKAHDALSHWLELEGSYYDQAAQRSVTYVGERAYLGGPLMFGAGLIAGLLGIGAGALKVLVLDLVMGLPSKVSTTTSNLIIGVTALAGTSVYLAAGLVDPGQVAPVVLGVVAGAFVGTQLLVRLRNRTVRNLFTVVLFVLGIEMIVRTALGGK
jgi:hypothetical protein